MTYKYFFSSQFILNSRWYFFCGIAASSFLGWAWAAHSNKEKAVTNYKKIPVKKNYPRLQNCSNICFINATLQSLACTSMVKWLTEINLFSTRLNNSNSDCSLQKTLTDIFTYLTGCRESTSRFYDASILLSVLRQYGWSISDEEHDAHEFFHVLLTTFDDLIMHSIKSSQLVGVTNSSLQQSIDNDNARFSHDLCFLLKSCNASHFLHETGTYMPCHHKFQGYTAISMTCYVCGHINPWRFESFDSLSIPITSHTHYSIKMQTLEQCLGNFFAPETLHEVNCDGCSKTESPYDSKFQQRCGLFKESLNISQLAKSLQGDAVGQRRLIKEGNITVKDMKPRLIKSSFLKRTCISKLPQSLCIHLQRLVWRSGYPYKQEQHVEFTEYLNLQSYLLPKLLKKCSSSQVNDITFLKSEKMPFIENIKNSPIFDNKIFGNLFKPTSFNAIPCFGLQRMRHGSCSKSKHCDNIHFCPGDSKVIKSLLYQLKAVIVHIGPWNSQGHFIAYRRYQDDLQHQSIWLYTSDSFVRKASIEEVLHSPAYMLFYERIAV